MKIDIVDFLQSNINDLSSKNQDWAITSAITHIKALRTAGRKVVDARDFDDADGWDKLDCAIGELQDLVGRSCPP